MGIQSHKVNEKTCSVIMRKRDENSFKKIKDGIFVYETGPDTSDCATIKIETTKEKLAKISGNGNSNLKQYHLIPDGKTVLGNSCKRGTLSQIYTEKCPQEINL